MHAYSMKEDIARTWLAELIVSAETGEFDADADLAALLMGATVEDSAVANVQPQHRATPAIGLGWDPRAPGQEDVTSQLIQQAQGPVGALAGPAHTHLELQYVDDGDDWAYQWLLKWVVPGPLTVASAPRPVDQLGGNAYGIDAALAVLSEAAHAANALLDQLAAFGPASPPEPGTSR
ncbi:hypothetical protein ACFQ07_32165 [Actinomadura adrarensis]|uniref:SRPBCC family protein n=1 Tax=Actinomadura adrarensis TaxID=1819600 RepID=A0ABW3CRT6_9ACTN